MKKLKLFLFLAIPSVLISQQYPPLPVLNSNEYYTELYSLSYDYQSNGSVKYIVQDPSNPLNLCAIMMAQHDSNSAAGTQRYIYYSYSSDGGMTWSANTISEAASQGFPCVTLSNGLPVISAGEPGGIRVWKDVVFGAFSFTELTGVFPSNMIWGQISGTTNGNVVLASSVSGGPTFDGQYTTYNGTWINPISLPHIGGPSGNYSVASGTNGIVGIFGTNYFGANEIYYYKSTDNGITFDNGTMIFNYHIVGTDTLYANVTGGLQAVYAGDVPHLVFTVYNVKNYVFPNPNTTAFVSPRILHWSPLTGITSVAGKFNIYNLTDTITNSSVVPVCQPSIALTDDGELLCSFTTYLRGNIQTVDNGDVLNAGEIFYVSSFDDGLNWYLSINITNTPDIEEKYSSLLPTGSDLKLRKIFYLRDLKAGNWVQNSAWGKAPVYGIFKKVRGAVGINQTNSIAESFSLFQNYPNPFNPSTVIRFSLFKNALTSLIVYDALGKEVVTLVNETLSAGKYESEFKGKDLPSGIYFYKLTSGDFSEVKKMMLVR